MTHPRTSDDFPTLFVQSQRRIYGYIMTVIPDPNEADEIFQETSLILWKKADQVDRDADFVSWACGIANNVIRNRRVKKSRDRHIFSDELLHDIAAVRRSRSSWLEERSLHLAKCMSRLSEGQRQLIKAFYGSRASARTIAQDQGVSENALYQRLHRIRRRLFECVHELLNEEAL